MVKEHVPSQVQLVLCGGRALFYSNVVISKMLRTNVELGDEVGRILAVQKI